MSIKPAENTIEIDVAETDSRACDIAAVKAVLKPHLDGARGPYYLSLQSPPRFENGRLKLVYAIFPAETYLRPQFQPGGLDVAGEREAA